MFVVYRGEDLWIKALLTDADAWFSVCVIMCFLIFIYPQKVSLNLQNWASHSENSTQLHWELTDTAPAHCCKGLVTRISFWQKYIVFSAVRGIAPGVNINVQGVLMLLHFGELWRSTLLCWQITKHPDSADLWGKGKVEPQMEEAIITLAVSCYLTLQDISSWCERAQSDRSS